MEPEIMQRIFDPFEQGNRSFERRFGGLGLGLAISKSLAQAHSGTLTAQSDGLDRGSTFVFKDANAFALGDTSCLRKNNR